MTKEQMADAIADELCDDLEKHMQMLADIDRHFAEMQDRFEKHMKTHGGHMSLERKFKLITTAMKAIARVKE